MKNIKRTSLLMWVGLLLASPLHAQEFSLGADVVSRYVWRGTDFGESASIQPSLAFSKGGFEIGTWASYAVNPESAGANEHDLWIGYSIASESGTFSLGATDYYFPNAGVEFFDFSDDGGAHQIEPYVSYSGPETFPISLWASIFAHNEPDNSVYLEASYPFSLDGTDLGLTVGVVPMESAFYGTTGAAIVNLGLSASRSIPFSDSFSLPISVSYILNPDMETSFLVFGVSL